MTKRGPCEKLPKVSKTPGRGGAAGHGRPEVSPAEGGLPCQASGSWPQAAGKPGSRAAMP
mgnify:CR=1 FL=1